MRKLIFPVFSSLLLAAHFSRAQNDYLALLCLLFPFILLVKKKWILKIFQVYLIIGGVIWIESILHYVQLRESLGRPWLRLVIILSLVSLFTVISAFILENRRIRERYRSLNSKGNISYLPSLIASFLTALLLSIVHFKVNLPLLLMERFFPGSGMIEIVLLAIYSGWITEKMLEAKSSPIIRSRIWILFSFVFFTQFILGFSGLEKFLMTGQLHLPIPALIIAGPIYRGERFFMLILFVSTVLLAGSAWCSHLCYLGSWDNLSSSQTRRPRSLPEWWSRVRVGVLLSIILIVYLLRLAGVSSAAVTIVAILYGVCGLGVIVLISRRNGIMTHCVIYCPVGLVANFLGRLNPFRIRIGETCDECQACQTACRYNALTMNDIKRRKPGISCTLCGDCLSTCSRKALTYGFLGLSPETARILFIVLIVSLHAVFLGVARI
jgi:NAD-dependent dihydropyrimidine dehydrogenase PreA subunit